MEITGGVANKINGRVYGQILFIFRMYYIDKLLRYLEPDDCADPNVQSVASYVYQSVESEYLDIGKTKNPVAAKRGRSTEDDTTLDETGSPRRSKRRMPKPVLISDVIKRDIEAKLKENETIKQSIESMKKQDEELIKMGIKGTLLAPLSRLVAKLEVNKKDVKVLEQELATLE